jgi:hypothetical protein
MAVRNREAKRGHFEGECFYREDNSEKSFETVFLRVCPSYTGSSWAGLEIRNGATEYPARSSQ